MAKRTLNPYRMIAGTTVDGVKVRPRINDELASVYYNSLLSALRPLLRLLQVYYDCYNASSKRLHRSNSPGLGGSRADAVIAAAMLDSTGRAAEGLQA